MAKDSSSLPANQLKNSSVNDTMQQLSLTRESVSALEIERRTAEKVIRWRDSLPDTFPRVPGNPWSRTERSISRGRDELLDGDMLARRSSTQSQPHPHPHPRLSDVEWNLAVNMEVEKRLRQMELQQSQRQHRQTDTGTMTSQGHRYMKSFDTPQNFPAVASYEEFANRTRNMEHMETNYQYLSDSDSPLANDPPPIPLRSSLRPRAVSFPEASPGSPQHLESYYAASPQSPLEAVLPRAATINGKGNIVKTQELGQRRSNPGLVAELRAGMGRRRQREREKDEDLQREREQLNDKINGWPLKLWK